MDIRDSPHYRADAPGARLDSQEWARSWPSYLAAVFSERDSSARRFIANAWSERTGSGGGFLVPEGLRAAVMAYLTPAVIRPRALVLPMDEYKLRVPALDNPSQASSAQALGGLTFSFTEQGNQIASSAPGFAETVLEARKLAAFMPVNNELVADGAGALSDFTSRVVAIGYQWAEDDYFIAGNGANGPEGIINASCALKVTRTSSGQAPVLLDILNLAKGLHPASKAAGYTAGITSVGWLISASVFDSLLELYFLPNATGGATAGSPITPSDWLSIGDGHEVAPSMLGLPASITDHQPAAGTLGDLALADMRNYVVGDRLEMTIEPSSRGSGFVTDITNYRIKARVDGRYGIPGPVTTETSQQVSPVVVLN